MIATNKKIEESILQEWMDRKIPVTVYLKNGISLKGQIMGHSDDSISLSNYKLISKVFKQAITTVSPCIAKS